jgi:hypothetical protein
MNSLYGMSQDPKGLLGLLHTSRLPSGCMGLNDASDSFRAVTTATLPT